MIPAHCSRAVELSKKRWIIFFSTMDMRGHDSAKSIVYQLRANRPDGRIIKERIIAENRNDWDPFQKGDRFWKCNDNPVVFGISKDACAGDKKSPVANHFVVKWCTYAHMEKNNKLYNSASSDWPGEKTVFNRTLRIEWAQFKLNAAEDDIEITLPPQPMVRKGYDIDHFSGLGTGFSMNHSLVPPVPLDDTAENWLEYDTFTREEESLFGGGHGRVAPVKYSFNRETRLYEWSETGEILHVPGLMLGESSICRQDHFFVVSFRVFNESKSVWLKTPDPLNDCGMIKINPGNNTPRNIFMCADNRIRLFFNDVNISPYHQKRNPLYACEIDGNDFRQSAPVLVFDAEMTLKIFETPFVDLPKLFPPCDGGQILAFRLISRAQTVGYKAEKHATEEAVRESGIHYVEITYS